MENKLKDFHWSDCAIHNKPAYPQGICDCTQADQRDLEDDLANPDVYKVGLVRSCIQEAHKLERDEIKLALGKKRDYINPALFKIVMTEEEWQKFWELPQ